MFARWSLTLRNLFSTRGIDKERRARNLQISPLRLAFQRHDSKAVTVVPGVPQSVAQLFRLSNSHFNRHRRPLTRLNSVRVALQKMKLGRS